MSIKLSNFKTYDPDLNTSAGLISKAAFSQWAERLGFDYRLIDEGDFGFDASMADVYFELETRYNWKEGNRPFYPIVHVPLRRKKHLHQEQRWMYAQVSGDAQALLVLPNPNIVLPQCLELRSKNKYDQGYSEDFINVPREKFKWVFVDRTCQDEQDLIDILLAEQEGAQT